MDFAGQVIMNLFPITLLNTYMRTRKNSKRLTKRARIIKTLLPVVPMWFVITIISFLATQSFTSTIIEIQLPEKSILGSSDYLKGLSNEEWASLRHQLGLDPPIHIHYLRWMGMMKQEDGKYGGVLQGNLGDSLWY